MSKIKIPQKAALMVAGLFLAISTAATGDPMPSALDRAAEDYVKLALGIGRYDPIYIDAYYGPPEWKPEPAAKEERFPARALRRRANTLLEVLNRLPAHRFSELEQQRRLFLQKQVTAALGRIDMLDGKKMSFDQESRLLYDAVAPRRADTDHEKITAQLERLLPGTEFLGHRVETFQKKFTIPADRLADVFAAAIAECRRRTNEHIQLPPGENFQTEFVSGQPWGAYNWYKGNLFSLIQINTDFPLALASAIGLAGHEGYPGHHVYNLLLETRLLKSRNWIEFSVYPLYSPQSLIAEGTANYGLELLFPGTEKLDFERRVLYPLAGLDAVDSEKYHRVRTLVHELGVASTEISRDYLDGVISHEEALRRTRQVELNSLPHAEATLRFAETYRSYIINYTLGEKLIREFITRKCPDPADINARWQLFERLLSEPWIPSMLK